MPSSYLEESILDSIKRPLGIEKDYTEFDFDLVMFINGFLMILIQNGVGTPNFRITGASETWGDFLGDFTDVELAKTFVYLRTKLMFDPPSSSAAIDACKNAADEALWRCLVEVENVRNQNLDN